MITKVDGKKVTKMAELQEILNGKRPGNKMSITYLLSLIHILIIFSISSRYSTCVPFLFSLLLVRRENYSYQLRDYLAVSYTHGR